MNLWKTISAKPTVWLVAGVVIGGYSFASLNTGQGARSAFADPTIKVRPISGLSSTSLNALETMDKAFSSLVESVSPAVVHIRSENSGQRGAMGGGQGSGVIYRADGWIVTNEHVVKGFDKVTVIMNDGQEYKGEVRRSDDPQNDLAIIKIDAKNLPAAEFGDSQLVKPGQYAIAIGAPFGLENTVTVGHISAIGRTNAVQDTESQRYYSGMIQTDAAINPGNSGGPLINIEGQVIGLNSSIVNNNPGSMFGGQGGNVGIGFAIPSNQIRLIADLLISKGKLTRGFLGLAPEDLKPYEAKKMGTVGAIVRQVSPDSPAAKAGIKVGDVITKIGSYPVRNQLDIRNAMLQYAPGADVAVEAFRDSKTLKLNATIGAPPKQAVASRQPQTDDRTNPFDRLDDFMKRDPGDQSKSEDETDPSVKSEQPRLGVQVTKLTPEARKEFNIPSNVDGVLVGAVEPSSIAEGLGLKAGDLITELDGKKLKSPEELVSAVKSFRKGDRCTISSSRYAKSGLTSVTRDFTF